MSNPETETGSETETETGTETETEPKAGGKATDAGAPAGTSADEAGRAVPDTGEHRALSEPAPRPSWLLANDLLVVIAALVILVGAYAAYGVMTRPALAAFDSQGLSFRYPRGWFPAGDATGFPSVVSFQSNEDPLLGVEAKITRKPALDGPIAPALDLTRGTRYGDMYQRLSSCTTEGCQPETRTAGGKQWLRTRFIYAFKPSDDDAPVVEHAVEYALVNTDKLYVVTIHGPENKIGALESRILATLAVR